MWFRLWSRSLEYNHVAKRAIAFFTRVREGWIICSRFISRSLSARLQKLNGLYSFSIMHHSSFESFLICVCEIVDSSFSSCALLLPNNYPSDCLPYYLLARVHVVQSVLAQITASFLRPCKISWNLDVFRDSRIGDLAFGKTSGCQPLTCKDTGYPFKSSLLCLRACSALDLS